MLITILYQTLSECKNITEAPETCGTKMSSKSSKSKSVKAVDSAEDV